MKVGKFKSAQPTWKGKGMQFGFGERIQPVGQTPGLFGQR